MAEQKEKTVLIVAGTRQEAAYISGELNMPAQQYMVIPTHGVPVNPLVHRFKVLMFVGKWQEGPNAGLAKHTTLQALEPGAVILGLQSHR